MLGVPKLDPIAALKIEDLMQELHREVTIITVFMLMDMDMWPTRQAGEAHRHDVYAAPRAPLRGRNLCLPDESSLVWT